MFDRETRRMTPERASALIALTRPELRDGKECWTFTGYLCKNGYGRFWPGSDGTGTKRTLLAHKVLWEHLFGPTPDNLVLDHTCRNRACVNPLHLELVTSAENTRRGAQARKEEIDRRLPEVAQTTLHPCPVCATCLIFYRRSNQFYCPYCADYFGDPPAPPGPVLYHRTRDAQTRDGGLTGVLSHLLHRKEKP